MRLILALTLALTGLVFPALAETKPTRTTPLTLVVMDPLAAELSCPCVAGYAQRAYGKLGEYLAQQLGRPVQVFYAETLNEALKKKTQHKADLIIGKDSVVRAGAKQAGIAITPLAALTGKDGKTTQTGLIVVASKDAALTVDDLKGYRVLFGPDDCEEKHGAALTLFRDAKIDLPKKLETCNSCTTGATKVLQLHKSGEKAAAVISSYAQPLLEGCGTIKKGELKVIGETDPVPFIVAFASDRLSAGEREAIQKALLDMSKDTKLCTAMETKLGFVALPTAKKK